MLPVTATTSFTTPPPLVNTTLPGTHETHVPPTTVAPSFSSPQVDNNARGNSTQVKVQAPPPPPPPALATPINASGVGVPPSASEQFTLGAQTNFLAQILGQDISPAAQGVLVQYENLVNISNVKYAPSDAGKPEEQPANLFGKLLQQEHSEPAQARAAAAITTAQTSSAAGIAASTSAHSEAVNASSHQPVSEALPLTRSAKSLHTFAEDLAEEEAHRPPEAASQPQAPQAAFKPSPPRGFSAYSSTVNRIPASAPRDESFDSAISEVA